MHWPQRHEQHVLLSFVICATSARNVWSVRTNGILLCLCGGGGGARACARARVCVYEREKAGAGCGLVFVCVCVGRQGAIWGYKARQS